MNTEILFRGKRVDNDEWVYGFLRCRNYIDVWTPHTWTEEDGSVGEYATVESYQVKLETVGEFTNLTDKNGNKIFEGDIVYNGVFKAQVEFINGRFSPFGSDIFFADECEVIGNIYDNKEWLK